MCPRILKLCTVVSVRPVAVRRPGSPFYIKIFLENICCEVTNGLKVV